MDLKFPSKLTSLGKMVGLLRDEAQGEEVRQVGDCLERVFGMLALPFLFLLFPFLHEVFRAVTSPFPDSKIIEPSKLWVKLWVNITKFSAIELVFFMCFIIMIGTTREHHIFHSSWESRSYLKIFFYLSLQFPPSCLPLSLSFSIWWLNSGLHTS